MQGNQVVGIWICPECEHKIGHSYDALVDVGNPICAHCDVDMEFTGEVKIEGV
jgi:hypothetical protein